MNKPRVRFGVIEAAKREGRSLNPNFVKRLHAMNEHMANVPTSQQIEAERLSMARYCD